MLCFSTTSIAINRGKPRGASEDLFQGNGVKGKCLDWVQICLKLLLESLETQSKDDMIWLWRGWKCCRVRTCSWALNLVFSPLKSVYILGFTFVFCGSVWELKHGLWGKFFEMGMLGLLLHPALLPLAAFPVSEPCDSAPSQNGLSNSALKYNLVKLQGTLSSVASAWFTGLPWIPQP